MELGGFPYLAERLTIKDNTVYARTGRGLAAYNIGNGREIWKNTRWDKNKAATTTLTIADNVPISGSQWGGLYANNLHTGDFLWELTEDGLSDRGSIPLYYEGKLYLISIKCFFIIDPILGRILTKKE